MFNYKKAPNDLGKTLQLYIEHGIPMGSFMMSVACNDLKEACGRADLINRHLLFEIVSWFYNEAPSNCWGSYERVKTWIQVRRENPLTTQTEGEKQ